MPDHPSIQGLREAVSNDMLDGLVELTLTGGGSPDYGAMALTTIAAYLTEHGVGWFREGLVRVRPLVSFKEHAQQDCRILVPVPQDSEES